MSFISYQKESSRPGGYTQLSESGNEPDGPSDGVNVDEPPKEDNTPPPHVCAFLRKIITFLASRAYRAEKVVIARTFFSGAKTI